ncbi:solute carrier family 22 member 22-like [Meriones unguiculatus]|uniref:solute carrier family 22 member 22-like n=1 Tax=Meriones unguiculatus TaxID=10047 RepID=UPI00293EFF5F|nr:solute carrier family 22 member 22-like [Meriones unguiculatus]
MAFDEILHHVGDSGRFQILMIVLSNILFLLSSCHDFMENFTAAIPDHHCRVNLLDNPITEINITMNLTTEAMMKVSIPMGPNQKLEQCRRFRHTQWQFLNPNISTSNITELETEPCLDGWTYDHSVFTSTIVTEWDLVCDFQSFKYYAQATSLAGHVLSSPLSGIVSDRFGRKPLLVYSCLAYGILGTYCAFVPNFSLYCVLRFLLSASMSTIMNNSLTLVLEEMSVKWCTIAVILSGLFMSIGQAGLGGLAYMLSDWHRLQLAFALPYFIFSLLFCLGPESARWLMTTGKIDRALKELQKIASINGKKDIAQNLTTEALRSKFKEDVNSTRKPAKIKNIIINPIMRKTMLCYSSAIFAEIFSSFGILLDIRILGKNIFLTQFLLGAVEIPSRLLTYFALRHVRRRPLTACLLLSVGSCITITMFLPEEMHVLRLILFLLAKGSYAASICVFMVYNQELTPTALRSTLSGIYSMVVRLAGMLSALVLVTRKYFVHLPMILYGILPIVAIINIYFLPETFNLPFIDDIKDMEKRNGLINKSISKKEEQDFLETTEC